MIRESSTARRDAEPLSEESQRLLEALDTARQNERGEADAWIAFLRSLSPGQQQVMLGLIEQLDGS